MLRKCLVCLPFLAILAAWMLALSQFEVRDRAANRATVCQCGDDCGCGLAGAECCCER